MFEGNKLEVKIEDKCFLHFSSHLTIFTFFLTIMEENGSNFGDNLLLDAYTQNMPIYQIFEMEQIYEQFLTSFPPCNGILIGSKAIANKLQMHLYTRNLHV